MIKVTLKERVVQTLFSGKEIRAFEVVEESNTENAVYFKPDSYYAHNFLKMIPVNQREVSYDVYSPPTYSFPLSDNLNLDKAAYDMAFIYAKMLAGVDGTIEDFTRFSKNGAVDLTNVILTENLRCSGSGLCIFLRNGAKSLDKLLADVRSENHPWTELYSKFVESYRKAA